MLKKYYQDNKQLIDYLIIGAMTTFVSYATFYYFVFVVLLDINLSNTISVVLAVCFAYFGNKLFVFRTRCESFVKLCKEIAAFLASRCFAMIVDIAGVFVLTDIVHIHAMISKVLVSVLVIIINYVLSKKFIFARSNQIK